MLSYDGGLKLNARDLRANMTDSESLLWERLRRKQILNVQFDRQKVICRYIVDFYGPKAKLVIEIDGSQLMDPVERVKDRVRDEYLRAVGLKVLRFNSREVLKETQAVAEAIYGTVLEQLTKQAGSSGETT